MKTELKVQGMSCGHCVAGVKGALEGVAGVASASVSLEGHCATVEHDGSATVEAMVAAIVEEGYTAAKAG